jgi:hypothetical protein
VQYRRFSICNALDDLETHEQANVLATASLQYRAARRIRNQSSADFQVCCVADFQIRRPSKLHRPADLEVGDTAGLETCATALPGASWTIFTDTDRLKIYATASGLVDQRISGDSL